MVESNWMRHSLRLGLVGVQRSFRRLRNNRILWWAYGFTFVCFVFIFGGMGASLAYALRTASTPINVPANFHMGITLVWLSGVWLFSRRVVMFHHRLQNEAFVLTTVSARTAVMSMLISESLFGCILLLLPTVACVGILGIAFTQILSLVMIPLASVLFVVSAAVIGFTLGFLYFHIGSGSDIIGQIDFSTVIEVLAQVGGIVVILAVATDGIIPQIEVPAFNGSAWLPTSWFIDLAALGTPIATSVGRAVGVLFSALVLIAIGSAVIERLAIAYWYGPSATAGRGETTELDASDDSTISPGTEVLAAALSPLFVPTVVNTPPRRVAQIALLRLRRAPRRLSFLVIPAFTFIVVLIVQTANPLRLIPPICAVAIPWLAGAAFGLNPLGDEGAVLPTILTSVSGREYVRGLMVPGILYGLPIMVVCTLIAGVFSPYSMIELGGLVVVGAILTVVAVVLAPAIGMRFPRFDAIIIGQRGGVIPPSLIAITIYTALVGILGGGAAFTIVGLISINHLLILHGVPTALVRLGGIVSVFTTIFVIVILSYNSAISQFSSYTFE